LQALSEMKQPDIAYIYLIFHNLEPGMNVSLHNKTGYEVIYCANYPALTTFDNITIDKSSQV